ncbi:MAG: PilZ domain-containing protein [Candidatus Omnitrophica bacterium]|nr:PilZ domain-containing protein [Candidatus Omnitrophota bacterium]
METVKNKREYKRIQKPFIVRFRVKPEKDLGGFFPGWDIVTAQNLSAGGILFNYDQRIELTSKLDLKINFPTMRGIIDCSGKVLRMDEIPNSARIRVAVIFADLNPRDKKDIEEYSEFKNAMVS